MMPADHVTPVAISAVGDKNLERAMLRCDGQYHPIALRGSSIRGATRAG
jgi:hypothetical protein